jgi:hypothetical protein
LCKLSYITSQDNREREELECRWIEALGIVDYTIWHPKQAIAEGGGNSVEGAVLSKLGQAALENATKTKNHSGGIAISGMLPNLSNQQQAPIPFICFRGTASPQDMLSDLESLIPEKFTTSIGTEVGQTGLGFWNHYSAIRKVKIDDEGMLEKTVKAAKANPDAGILIAGHSLGAAAATLCAAELYADNKDKFKILIVTFGSPRVFDEATTETVSNFEGIRHLRFINTGDMITTFGGEALTPLCHTGIPIVFPPVAAPAVDDENPGVPERHLDWHVIPKTHSQNYSLVPKSVVTAMQNFALSAASSHSVSAANSNGKSYLDKFLISATFLNALNDVKDPVAKKSFDLKQLFGTASTKPEEISQ